MDQRPDEGSDTGPGPVVRPPAEDDASVWAPPPTGPAPAHRLGAGLRRSGPGHHTSRARPGSATGGNASGYRRLPSWSA